MATELWDRIPDDSLTIVDRGFLSYIIVLYVRSMGTERHFLTRAKSTTRYRTQRVLPDGSAIVTLEAPKALRRYLIDASSGNMTGRQARDAERADLNRENRAYYRTERRGRNTWNEVARVLRRGGEVQLDTADPPTRTLKDLLTDVVVAGMSPTRISCTRAKYNDVLQCLQAMNLQIPLQQEEDSKFYLEAVKL